MDDWASYLHWDFRGEHVLIPQIRLRSTSSFLIGSILTICVCVTERCVSRLLDKHWTPPSLRHVRWQSVVWRGMLYWFATFLRLSYMLISMTFHLGLLFVMITSLTIAQAAMDLLSPSLDSQLAKEHRSRAMDSEEPLLQERSFALSSLTTRDI